MRKFLIDSFYLNASFAFGKDVETTTKVFQTLGEQFLDPDQDPPDINNYSGKVKDLLFFYFNHINMFL